MNLKKMKNYSITFLAVIGLILTSCESGENLEIADSISLDEAKALIALEDASNEADNIVDDFINYDLYASKSTSSKSDEELNCRTKTVVTEGNIKTVTIDFGEECTTPNGNVVSGKILIVIELNQDEETRTAKTTYDNFFVNDRQITGEKIMFFTRSNDNGNLQTEISHNIEVIFPEDEGTIKREGTKTREMIDGGDTRRMSDNTYSITGYWVVTFQDGTKMEAEVAEALIRNGSCKFIVEGVLEIEKEGKEGSIHFGDGTCDDSAIFIDDEGVETEIILKSGKRRK